LTIDTGFLPFRLTMMIKNRIFTALMLLQQCILSDAFCASSKLSARSTQIFMADAEEALSAVPKEAGVEPGSHDELMYSLGVNLARYVCPFCPPDD
jgi:hypothetical protein